MLITLTLLFAAAIALVNRQHARHMASLTPEQRADYEREVIADLGIL